MAAKRSAEASADTASVFGEDIVMPAVHLRLDRVRCACGDWVDADDLSKARHLIGEVRRTRGDQARRFVCKWATEEVRTAARAVLAELVDEKPTETSTPLRPPTAVSSPPKEEISVDTATYIDVLAMEDAPLVKTAENPGPQLVRELWEINFLDLPLSSRLELRSMAGDPGLLYYAVCLSRYFDHSA